MMVETEQVIVNRLSLNNKPVITEVAVSNEANQGIMTRNLNSTGYFRKLSLNSPNLVFIIPVS